MDINCFEGISANNFLTNGKATPDQAYEFAD